MQVNLVYRSMIPTLTLTFGGWARVACSWAALQANSLTNVSAARVPDELAAGQLCLQHWPTRVAGRVKETDPKVRLFWVGFTSPIVSTEFSVTLAELTNKQPYEPGKVEVLSYIASAPHGHLPSLSCHSLWLLILVKYISRTLPGFGSRNSRLLLLCLG